MINLKIPLRIRVVFLSWLWIGLAPLFATPLTVIPSEDQVILQGATQWIVGKQAFVPWTCYNLYDDQGELVAYAHRKIWSAGFLYPYAAELTLYAADGELLGTIEGRRDTRQLAEFICYDATHLPLAAFALDRYALHCGAYSMPYRGPMLSKRFCLGCRQCEAETPYRPTLNWSVRCDSCHIDKRMFFLFWAFLADQQLSLFPRLS